MNNSDEQNMCNFNQLIGLITASILALAALIGAAAMALGIPYPGNLLLLAIGVAAAGTALALIHALVNSLTEYRSCLNSQDGESLCSFGIVQGFGEAARVGAATTLASMVTALAAGAVPVIGNLTQVIPVKVAWITAMFLIALLTALLLALLSYRRCHEETIIQGNDGDLLAVNPPSGVEMPGGIARGIDSRVLCMLACIRVLELFLRKKGRKNSFFLYEVLNGLEVILLMITVEMLVNRKN